MQSNHISETRNFNASIFVTNKFMLKFHWKSVFAFLSATCDNICWSSSKDNSSFLDLDEFSLHFQFGFFRLRWNTLLALIHLRLFVLIIQNCMTVNRFLSTCILNQQENAYQLIRRGLPKSSNSRSRWEFDLASLFLSQRYWPHCF